ncbi:MAG TPA: energy transducer TonB, partial [Gammaproteobacteria bacterium]
KDQGIANKYFAEAAATPVETLQELHTAIYEILDSHKVYPKEAIAAHQQGTVKVTFVVPNRTVAAYTIDRSSGYPSLDQAARQALADCLFPPKAPSLQGVTKLTVDMTFNLGSKPLVPAATTSASPASSTH